MSSAQVIEVAGQAVHAVHHDSVSVPCEPQQLGQFRPGRVPPEALSVKTRSKTWPSGWRFSFWSSVLTRTYPTRCPATAASNPPPVRLTSRPVIQGSQTKAVHRQVGCSLTGRTLGTPAQVSGLMTPAADEVPLL